MLSPYVYDRVFGIDYNPFEPTLGDVRRWVAYSEAAQARECERQLKRLSEAEVEERRRSHELALRYAEIRERKAKEREVENELKKLKKAHQELVKDLQRLETELEAAKTPIYGLKAMELHDFVYHCPKDLKLTIPDLETIKKEYKCSVPVWEGFEVDEKSWKQEDSKTFRAFFRGKNGRSIQILIPKQQIVYDEDGDGEQILPWIGRDDFSQMEECFGMPDFELRDATFLQVVKKHRRKSKWVYEISSPLQATHVLAFFRVAQRSRDEDEYGDDFLEACRAKGCDDVIITPYVEDGRGICCMPIKDDWAIFPEYGEEMAAFRHKMLRELWYKEWCERRFIC